MFPAYASVTPLNLPPGRGNGIFRLRLQQPGDPSLLFPHSYVAVERCREEQQP
jgi:hypothetical protein